MAVTNIIKLSELEGAKRVDAEYYQPEYFYLLDKLRRSGAVPVRKISLPAKRKFHPKENEVFDYIEIAEVDLSTGEANTSRIVGKEAPDRAQWIVKKDDVLVSTVRPIRNAVVLVREKQDNLVCSSGFCVLQPKDISPEYLFLYFKTDTIAYLLDRYTTATEYPAVSWDDILNIPIYLGDSSFRKNISNLVQKAFALLEESKALYSQAEIQLLEELKLKDFKPKYEVSYTANLSKAFGAHRVDAEYFQPAYEEVIKKIVGYGNGSAPLLSCVENIKSDFDPTKYPGKSFSYVELSNIDTSIGIIHSISEIKGEEAPSRARRVLRNKDVIVSSVEGSLEKVALVNEEYEESLASTGFFQFRAVRILPEVLLVLSKSMVLQAQLKKECTGTILTAVPNSSLKRILIPVLQDKTQQKIASFVQQSHEARRKAKELLAEAKSKVEEAIENEIKK